MNPYEILNVNRTSTVEEIKKAFHKLALLYHPDKNRSVEAIDKFRSIKTAYDILIDTNKRKEYDDKLNFEKELRQKYEQTVQNCKNSTYYYSDSTDELLTSSEEDGVFDLGRYSF